jgi:putative transposase
LLRNHFHLLLQTGTVPVATVMRRLLTGYATKYNRRHGRHGHLFQNRYKSILCQEELYLLELVRYIHLNPFRAEIVTSLEELKSYRYSGHNRIMTANADAWFAADDILKRFGNRQSSARLAYAKFIAYGVTQGRRDDLMGGGLYRSAGGWSAVLTARTAGIFLKSDERILGESGFVEQILAAADEEMERKARYAHQGLDLEKLAKMAADVLEVDPNCVETPGKQPERVRARDLFCYWAVRELGATATSIARRLGLTQPAVSVAVKRGERYSSEKDLRLDDILRMTGASSGGIL